MPDLPARPVRVAIVNDYEIVIAGVGALLAPYAERVSVVEVDSRETPVSDVDVVLYDTFGQTQGRAIEVGDLQRLTGARVLIFSWNTDPALVSASLTRGAGGYALKSATAAELVDAVERVAAGEQVRPVGDAEAVNETGDWPGQAQGLTAREAEVLALITQGLSNQEIADRCYLSINSVKTYIRTAYRKMGVARRSQAVLWGIEHGFEPDRFRRLQG